MDQRTYLCPAFVGHGEAEFAGLDQPAFIHGAAKVAAGIGGRLVAEADEQALDVATMRRGIVVLSGFQPASRHEEFFREGDCVETGEHGFSREVLQAGSHGGRLRVQWGLGDWGRTWSCARPHPAVALECFDVGDTVFLDEFDEGGKRIGLEDGYC